MQNWVAYSRLSPILQQPGQRTMKSKNLRYNPVRIVRKDYCCSWSWPGSAEHWKTLRLSNNAKTTRSAKTTRLIFKNIAKNVQTFKSQIFHEKRNTEKKDYLLKMVGHWYSRGVKGMKNAFETPGQ